MHDLSCLTCTPIYVLVERQSISWLSDFYVWGPVFELVKSMTKFQLSWEEKEYVDLYSIFGMLSWAYSQKISC